MPSKAKLKKQIKAARKAKNSGTKAIKEITDVHVPSQARADRANLLKRLRRIVHRMQRRIPKLRKRIENKRKDGADKAVKWAKSQVGVTESAGSNWGHPVQDWIIYTGYSSPVPWCGCFVAYAAVKVGGADIPTRVRLGYTPYICQDGANGANGLKKVSVSKAQPGDLIVFNFGSGGAKHVGLCISPTSGGETKCVEGNTSSSNGGSQDNGGAVAYRERPVSHAICAARPDYR